MTGITSHPKLNSLPLNTPPPPPHTGLFLPWEAATGVERRRASGHAAAVRGISRGRGRHQRCDAADVRGVCSFECVCDIMRDKTKIRTSVCCGGVAVREQVVELKWSFSVCVCDQVCSGFMPNHSGATMTSCGVRTHTHTHTHTQVISIDSTFYVFDRKQCLTTFPRGPLCLSLSLSLWRIHTGLCVP